MTSDLELTVLEALRSCTNLEALFLSDCSYREPPDQRFLDHLADLMPCVTRIESLSLPRMFPLYTNARPESYHCPGFQSAWKNLCSHLQSLRYLYTTSIPISQEDLEKLVLLRNLERWEIDGYEDGGFVPALFRLLPFSPDIRQNGNYSWEVELFYHKPLMSAQLLWYVLTQAEINCCAGETFDGADILNRELFPIARDRKIMIRFLLHNWNSVPKEWRDNEKISALLERAKLALSSSDLPHYFDEGESYSEDLDPDFQTSYVEQ